MLWIDGGLSPDKSDTCWTGQLIYSWYALFTWIYMFCHHPNFSLSPHNTRCPRYASFVLSIDARLRNHRHVCTRAIC